jgi:site-specific recombinase XerD
MEPTRGKTLLVSGPLEGYAAGFFTWLTALGYAPRSLEAQLRLVRDLSAWLAGKGLQASGLTDEVVSAFVVERRRTRTTMRSERAVAPLLGYLRELGVAAAPGPEAPTTAAATLLESFGLFLSLERGLAPETVHSYLSLVRPFVAAHADRPGVWASLRARDVDSFLVARAVLDCPASLAVRANALRVLLRWMWREHLVAGALPAAVGQVAARGPSTLAPAGFDEDEIARLFAALPEDRLARLRGQAILGLLVRLGLRAGEVAALRLEDLRWRSGVIRVRGKRGRVDELPLPTDVGAALGRYLRTARPSGTGHREVFLGVDAPHAPIGRAAITSLVIRARDRAGIAGPGGAHRLRHSAACSVLAAGGGLAEVAQLLRHEHPGVSSRYAHASPAALAELARPWPREATR